MERLTNNNKLGIFATLKDKLLAQVGAFKNYETFYAVNIAINKLYDYENTNLTPAEIEQLKAELSELKKNAIIPKFKIGQKVWILGDKTPLVARVIGFEIFDDENENRYWVSGYLSPFNEMYENCVPLEHIDRTFYEPHITSDLFATKAEAEQALAKIKGEKL